ncbi:MAG: family 16 glycoside hydrolase [Bryobacteraceae bacterium]|nr:family 16 glycoside hydrolase [Bryobacteraceae bacterium]
MRMLILALPLMLAAAETEPARRGALLLEDDFSAASIHPAWRQAKGQWQIVNGALKGVEIASDKHAAVVRRPVAYHDAVIEFSFRLDGARLMHLSLNSSKGHACRVTVDPKGFTLRKDKTNAKSTDKAELLARREMKFEPGKWYTMTVEVRGQRMSARVNGQSAEGAHEGIDVDKADIGFPVAGDSASIDNVKVWAIR